jgi:hypothetical protein
MDRDAQCRTSEEMALRMAQPNQTDEAAIIEAILAGNSELFYDLIRPHEQSVYRMAKEGRELALCCRRFILQSQYWTRCKTQ